MNDWRYALRNTGARCYRPIGNRYEAYASDHSKYINLGTYSCPGDAEEASFNYKADRLRNAVGMCGLNIDDGVVVEDHYLAFRDGHIFNLHGDLMRGGINRDGYINGILNGKNVQYHRIIAEAFCDPVAGKTFVNHKDGNKMNNASDNLEWTTRSENALHSFRNGLQQRVGNTTVYTDSEREYIRKHCFDNPKDVAKHLNRGFESVRKYMYKYRKEHDNA